MITEILLGFHQNIIHFLRHRWEDRFKTKQFELEKLKQRFQRFYAYFVVFAALNRVVLLRKVAILFRQRYA